MNIILPRPNITLAYIIIKHYIHNQITLIFLPSSFHMLGILGLSILSKIFLPLHRISNVVFTFIL
jgi:hypothetical protein